MTRGRKHGIARAPASCRKATAPPAITGLVVALLVAPAGVPSAVAGELSVGGAATRGFFEWAVIGGYTHALVISDRGGQFALPLRIDGTFSTRDNVTNIVAGFIPTVSYTPPGFEDNHFVPYVATGPGFHLQGAWSNLENFGGIETKSEAVAKWHVFLGASLARGRRADLFIETRYTKPSKFDFDYLHIGVRIHPARR